MSLETYYRDTLMGLVQLAKNHKEYAWGMAKQLDADPTGIFKGIAEDLKNLMLKEK